MNKELHPEYHQAKVTCMSCGNEFTVGSTEEEIKVEVCNNCHPFYSGKQRTAERGGKIERFNKKYGRN